MNIKITEEEFGWLKDKIDNTAKIYHIGSRLYETNRDDSDHDILVVYKSLFPSDKIYKNYHQLQYDDIENNAQWILTTEESFWGNLLSGDSSINADVVMFYGDYDYHSKLNICRTSNIIKSFIGFAKRDIKYANKEQEISY
jgi:hypothetical protein